MGWLRWCMKEWVEGVTNVFPSPAIVGSKSYSQWHHIKQIAFVHLMQSKLLAPKPIKLSIVVLDTDATFSLLNYKLLDLLQIWSLLTPSHHTLAAVGGKPIKTESQISLKIVIDDRILQGNFIAAHTELPLDIFYKSYYAMNSTTRWQGNWHSC